MKIQSQVAGILIKRKKHNQINYMPIVGEFNNKFCRKKKLELGKKLNNFIHQIKFIRILFIINIFVFIKFLGKLKKQIITFLRSKFNFDIFIF